MSDSNDQSSNEAIGKRSIDLDEANDPPDIPKKRPRGPLDCLNWSDSEEEEFVPYTQSNPSPPACLSSPPRCPTPTKVLTKKSAAKNRSAKNGASKEVASKGATTKQARKKSCKNAKSFSSEASKAKGKSLGKFIF